MRGANADLMISILGLSGFFQLIVTGDDCERSNPFPEPYLRAFSLLGEDRVVGVQAAGKPVMAIAEVSREAKAVVTRYYQDAKLWAALDKLDGATGGAAEASKANGEEKLRET